MAINVEALKAKLDKMNGVGKKDGNYPSHLWKPDYGNYTIRVIPWPEGKAGNSAPFIERWFYYDLGRGLVAPALGEPDPVRELRDMLFEDRTEANLAMARKLRPKMRAFLPIVVRDSENKTEVKIWSIGQTVYKQLLSYLVDPDWGDITDVQQGRDLTVAITDSGKKFADGTPIKDINVTCKPATGPLFKSKSDIDTALGNVPNLDEIYEISSYEKLSQALDRFVNNGVTGQQETRGGSSSARAQSAPQPKTSSLDDEFDSLLNG